MRKLQAPNFHQNTVITRAFRRASYPTVRCQSEGQHSLSAQPDLGQGRGRPVVLQKDKTLRFGKEPVRAFNKHDIATVPS